MAEGEKGAQRPPAPARRRRRARSAVDRVREVNFPIVFRGYERSAVDSHLADLAQLVTELESRQLRESVVQKALDEVGEQTSSILQKAHASAEEIDARSRSQAEGRIQRAEREAEEIRREADAYAEQVATDARRLWEERSRLLDEIRQLAEEVLGVADAASDRLPDPPGPREPEPVGDTTAEVEVEDTTAEVELEDPTAEIPAPTPADDGERPPSPQAPQA